ncbi:MAG: LysE family translocator [Elusimicrobiota bacterium]|nr:LysE family translocator [Elusimicrobiota bacterium]
MMPGPVFAVTLSKGYESPLAGIGIALGHGIVELPLIAIIYFGFARFFHLELVKAVVGIAGGSILIYMGSAMFRIRHEINEKNHSLSEGLVFAGFLTTVSNPYFFVWWATIGAALMTKAITFGLMGILLFVLVHWLSDLSWYYLVSSAVYRSKHLWNRKLHGILFGLCGAILIGFGGWFIFSAII